jgi:flavorubredoxin
MDIPIRACETERLAPDTFLIRQLAGEGIKPVAVYVNSLVITGREPIIVDCGPAIARDLWLDQALAVVEPADVRWIFLSHDDPDHTGSLLTLLDRCPKATLVTNWFTVERMSAEYLLPLDRLRWVNDGESFSAGDRSLIAVVPPTFDSPTTRGLFDTATGVYWASDSFSTPVTHEVSDVADMDPGFFRDGFLMFQRMLSPWHQWLDAGRYDGHLQRVQTLNAQVVASAHGPALRGDQIDAAFRLLVELPHLPPAEQPGQAELDLLVRAVAQATAAA